MLDPLSLITPDAPTPVSTTTLPTRRLLTQSPADPNDFILELDYSSISTFVECARKGENYLIRSRELRVEPTATSFGQLFHKCEELRLRHGWSDAVAQKQRELVASHFQEHPVPPDEYRNATRMTEVLTKYNALYAHDGWPDKVVQYEGEKLVERPFKIELCSFNIADTIPYPPHALVADWTGDTLPGFYVNNLHVLYTGRMDAVLENSNYLWVADHKTSSRGGPEYFSAFRLSLQTRGYAWAAHKLGFPVAGLIMNAVIVLPPAKTERAKTPRETFERPSYFYSPDSLAEWEESMKSHISTFVQNLTAGYFPQAARSFKSPCAGCAYHDNCSLPLHQREADLASSLYRDVTWSPINE